MAEFVITDERDHCHSHVRKIDASNGYETNLRRIQFQQGRWGGGGGSNKGLGHKEYIFLVLYYIII